MPADALLTTSLHSLPLLARGKVRDNYAVGEDRILMVATDRLSAFDVVLGEPIPGKGALLTQMALFWFGKLEGIVPNHLTGEAPESVVQLDEVAQVRDRSMLVKRLKPLPIEAVVRGYLAGSGWKEYQESQSVCGVRAIQAVRLTRWLVSASACPAGSGSTDVTTTCCRPGHSEPTASTPTPRSPRCPSVPASRWWRSVPL